MLACVVGVVSVGFMCWHVLGMSVKGMRVKSFSRGHAGCVASVGASSSFNGGPVEPSVSVEAWDRPRSTMPVLS